MGKYLINGSKYEIDDSIQGDDLTKTLRGIARNDAPSSGNPQIDNYLDETDDLLGLTPGTSARQINQESHFDPHAVSPVGAKGLAQVMPETLDAISKRLKRKLDPFNEMDAIQIHRELMKENMAKWGNEDDALRAYNSGWHPEKWNNPETNHYLEVIKPHGVQPPATPPVSPDEVAPPAPVAPAPAPAPTAAAPAFVPYAHVREDVDPATLNTDKDWLSASRQIYSLRERKSFQGSDTDLAEYGKSLMGNFNSNMVDMARYGADLARNGTEEDKRAFVFMMDTYDNTKFSWEGAERAAKGMLTDPTNLIGLGTLGVGSVGKVMATAAAKQGLKKLLLTSLGRTGLIAGAESAIMGTAQDAIKQGVEVTAGQKEGVSVPELAGNAAAAGIGGVVLGTAGDAALSAISGVIRRAIPRKAPASPVAPHVEPALDPHRPVDPRAPVAPPAAPAAAAPAPSLLDPVINPPHEAAPPVPSATPGVPSEAAAAPPVAPAVAAPAAVPTLPKDLAGAKPRWKTSEVTFESDVDKALFITSQQKKSARDGDYRDWLKSLGMTDEDITTHGATVRQALKAEAEGADGDIHLQQVIDHKLPEETPPVTPEVPAGPPPSGELTPDEIAAATARKQKGRLWVDDLPPVEGANDAAAADILIPYGNRGLRSTPRSMAELTADGAKVADQLRGLDDKTMAGVLESFRQGSLPLEESRIVARGVQMHADELRIEQATLIKKLGLSTKAQDTVRMMDRLTEVENRLVPLGLADDAFGSMAGSMLRQRQEGLGLHGVTVESIMADQGMTKEAAEATYVRLVGDAEHSAKAQAVTDSYDTRIADALQRGDLMEVSLLSAMKHREMAALGEVEMPGSASFMAKALELAISNVFTPTTLLINLVPAAIKTLVLPAARALVTDPLKLATRVEMGASYSAMASTVGMAMRAARAAFRYEQSLLTRGTGRILEGEMALTGRSAGVIRFFPRILNATDEFLGQINYAGFVSGRAAGDAATRGTAQGLTGDALDTFIKDATKTAMEEAYRPHDGDSLVQPLVNKGVNLGLTGEDLLQYVEREALRDPEALRHGADETSLDLVRDVLFKRKFSGKGEASSMAKAYEQAMNKAPSLKLILGQLFFRTPIRVFEEGVRLTPGLQFLAPKFMGDLAGRNGTLRQARAQAEAMASLSLTGAILSLYSAGRITGDGARDNWRADRTAGDGPGQPPYTIKMSDGSTWSYRNFDPVSTPFKIIVNGLERMDKLAIRQSQGEFIEQSAWDQGLAYVSAGTMAVAAAFRDANLTAGVDQMIKFGQDLADPESKEDAWVKLAGEKLALLVPNTVNKLAKQNDPTIKDPADFWQVVETRLAGLHVDLKDVKTAYSYDVLGNPRQMADTGSLWNIFSTASTEERGKGHSPEALTVLTELDRLQKETGAVFSPPLKNKMTGDFDLRTTLTADGKETLYDRWQDNYRALRPDHILYPIVTAPMPDGTFKQKAMRVETINKVMNELRQAAFTQLLSSEQTVIDRVIKTETDKAKATSGMLDFSNRSK